MKKTINVDVTYAGMRIDRFLRKHFDNIPQSLIERSLRSGKILKINIMDGIIEDVIKIDRNIISRPYVYNKKMFFITDGSLIKYN